MMRHSRIVSAVLLALLLPSCSLIIDTNPDGVIYSNGAAGNAGQASGLGSRGGTLATQGGAAAGGTSTGGDASGSGGVGAANGGQTSSAGVGNSGGLGMSAGGAVTTAAGAGAISGNGGTVSTGGQASAGASGASCGAAACAVGTYSCGSSTLQRCELTASGCPSLVDVKTCTGDTPVCNASVQRCDCKSTAPATCNGVNATLVCSATTGKWENVPCASSTPACTGSGVCAACTEHSQCPGSACHLAGPKKGTCFEAKYVKRVATVAELRSLLTTLPAPGEVAVQLAAGKYTASDTITILGKQEVAILGDATRPIWSGNGAWSDDRTGMFQVEDSGVLYLAGIRLEESTPGSCGIRTVSGSILWLDDFYSSGYAWAVRSSSTETHVRRSFLRSARGNALLVTGTFLSLENTVLAPATEYPWSAESAAIWTGTFSVVYDIRYSTIVGGPAAISCDSILKPSGSIRNSILLSGSTSGSPMSAECETINQIGNYAPSISYTSAWFVDPANGDFHLTAGGKAAVPQTAQWAAGDPTVDIDGQARPTTSVGYPGVDQS